MEAILVQTIVERCGDIALDESRIGTWQAEMVTPESARALAAVFKALCDPARLRLISLLVRQEFCLGALAAVLRMEQSTISHQLRDKRRLGLVSFCREGRHAFYRLDDPHVRNLLELGLAHSQH
jgi:DNA-binding transcriptional ArsR family regulator